MSTTLTAALVAMCLASQGQAQSLEQRIAGAPAGAVTFDFAARTGICGNATNTIIRREDDSCPAGFEPGPIVITLERDQRQITKLAMRVGSRVHRRGTGLGTVATTEATRYLLSVATAGREHVAEAALGAAAMADSVVLWRAFVAIARDRTLPTKVRGSALFWVGQAAGDRVEAEMGSIAADATEDREIREMAAFALAQRPRDEGIPVLLRLARSDRDPQIRRSAIFWLGQSGDERAMDYFESVLSGRR